MTTVSSDAAERVAQSGVERPYRALVRELAALTIESTDLSAWERFGSEVLGMTVVREDGEVRLRMDEYPFRFLIRKADRDGIAGMIWVSRGPEVVAEIRERWKGRGGSSRPIETTFWNPDSADSFAFEDHRGLLHQVFDVGPAGQTPFEPSDSVAGFVTGDAGLGHLVLFDNVDEANAVYVDAFNMSLREDAKKTQVGGRGRFYGCNSRHHTVAAVEVPGKEPGVMHLMVEMLTIDDVGASLDRARCAGWNPRTSLGRHPDHVISYYVPSPGGFDFEVGYDGLVVVSDSDWDENKLSTRAPAWGHDGIKPKS